MKKIKLLILLVLIISIDNQAQELSQTQKLESTAKIWGFLKYYHPQVAKGEFNWDDELIQLLPKIEEAKNKEELSTIYLSWIETLGEVQICKKCNEVKKDVEYFNKNFNLSWIQDENMFNVKLSNKLRFIEINRFQGKSKYIKLPSGGIEIRNEPEYTNFEYPNQSYRLLTLFRYWNIIEYFFPYKYQTDQDWNDVLTEMIPKFKNSEDTIAYHLAMLELVNKIDDSHSGEFTTKYSYKYFGSKMPSIKHQIIDDKAIITGFYNDSLALLDDLKFGDVITKVNGKLIAQILKEKSPFVPASNKDTKERYTYHLFNGHSDSISITFERNGIISKKVINRYSFKDFNYIKPTPIKSSNWELLNENVGYVNMKNLKNKDVPKMMKIMRNCNGIIFDLRNYPNDPTDDKLAKYLNSTKKYYARLTSQDPSYPGKFVWGDKTLYKCGKKNKKAFQGVTIILVNNITQSMAELMAMCLQTADNAIVLGSQTAGSDGPCVDFDLPGGYLTTFSGNGVFYPNGTETQRIGIVPDIVVKPTIEGIRLGKDEVLKRAIEHIHNIKNK